MRTDGDMDITGWITRWLLVAVITVMPSYGCHCVVEDGPDVSLSHSSNDIRHHCGTDSPDTNDRPHPFSEAPNHPESPCSNCSSSSVEGYHCDQRQVTTPAPTSGAPDMVVATSFPLLSIERPCFVVAQYPPSLIQHDRSKGSLFALYSLLTI